MSILLSLSDPLGFRAKCAEEPAAPAVRKKRRRPIPLPLSLRTRFHIGSQALACWIYIMWNMDEHTEQDVCSCQITYLTHVKHVEICVQ